MSRRVRAGLAAVVMALLGACAHRADITTLRTSDAALAAVRSAPDAAGKAGSAHFEMTIAIDGPTGPYELVATGGYSDRRLSMQMDLGAALAQAAAATGETVPDGVTGPMEIVVDGDTTYLRLPSLAAVTGSRSWLAVQASDLGVATSSIGVGATDPAQLLASLRGMSDDIAEVGTEDVRGVPTTHLAGTVEVARALERVPAAQRGRLEAQLETLGAAAAGIPVDVWIDADDLVRRFQIDLSKVVQGSGGGARGSATMTLELFDYGEPVSITVPDPSETSSYRDVLGALGGQR